MKSLLSCASIFFLTLTAPSSTQQSPEADSCRFTVSPSASKPTITGPDDVTSLVHVVEQPDSPVEIVAADFKDSFVAVAHEQFTQQLRCSLKVHNRSDRWIRRVNIMVYVASTSLEGAGSGFGLEGPGRAQNLAPGQEIELQGCGGGGSGGAAGNHVRIVVFVGRVDLDACFYVPSKRYPRPLGGNR
jgi:hypothetical protein